VPIFPDDPEIPANQAAWQTLAAFERPFLTSFSDDDPLTAGMEQVLEDRIAGAKGVEHIIIENAGHFLQEDQGPVVATKMIEFIRANPVG
jgi:haloalkane dehalogenase